MSLSNSLILKRKSKKRSRREMGALRPANTQRPQPRSSGRRTESVHCRQHSRLRLSPRWARKRERLANGITVSAAPLPQETSPRIGDGDIHRGARGMPAGCLPSAHLPGPERSSSGPPQALDLPTIHSCLTFCLEPQRAPRLGEDESHPWHLLGRQPSSPSEYPLGPLAGWEGGTEGGS